MSKALYAVSRSIGRDSALTTITAEIDPSRWSRRKKNIITGALRDGVASCGRDTSRFIQELLEHHTGRKLPAVSHWWASISPEHIKPERLHDLLAYTAAWIRLKQANLPAKDPRRPYYHPRLGYSEKNFLDALEQGVKIPNEIPLPTNISHKERGEFIREFIREQDSDYKAACQELIDMIENDVPISFTFHNH